MKKFIFILFITLFLNVDVYAENNNKEDVKSYINLITSDDYIITPNDYDNLSLMQNKIDAKDMKVISLKLEKDIVRYPKNKFNKEFNLYMEQFKKSGIYNEYTLDFLNKNYAVDIDYNLLLKLIKAYYYLNLKDDYKELANNIMKYISLKTDYDDKEVIYMLSDDDLGWNKNYLKNIDSVFEYFLLLSNLEIHHGDALGRYVYTGSKPLKINGIFTLSNINNVEIAYPNERLNGYLPKTDFMSYDKSVQLNQISIRPKKFTYSSNIYPNILETGLLGEVNFDAEITIGMDSKIDLSRDPEENIITMYIDEVKLNKVTGSVKYNKEEYGKPYSNTYVYKLSSSDGYVNLRNAPNGKIIQKININNNKDTLVYHYAGLYDFKNSEGSLYVENLQEKFYKKSFDYYNKINKLLNMKDHKSGSWYKVVYFPDETNEDAVTGYIHSSQLKFIKKSDNEYY